MNWEIFLSAFGGTAALLALLGFFGKAIVNFWLGKDLETHKARLKAESETELAKLESQLSILTNERHIVFSHLHEKRAEIISALYAKLNEAFYGTRSLLALRATQDEPDISERIASVRQNLTSAFRHFEQNKIWFSLNTGELIDTLIIDMSAIGMSIKYSADQTKELEDEEAQKLLQERWNTFVNDINEKLPLALTTLESDFRSLMGVIESEGDKQ